MSNFLHDEKSGKSPTTEGEYFYGYRHGDDGEEKARHYGDVNSVVTEELKPLKGSDPEDSDPKDNAINNNGFGSKPLKEKLCTDFDEILEMIGSQGKFQQILLYVVLCPIVTVSPFLVLNTVFMWDIPDHYCHVPGKPAETTIEEWKNLTLPWLVCSMLQNITFITEICQPTKNLICIQDKRTR